RKRRTPRGDLDSSDHGHGRLRLHAQRWLKRRQDLKRVWTSESNEEKHGGPHRGFLEVRAVGLSDRPNAVRQRETVQSDDALYEVKGRPHRRRAKEYHSHGDGYEGQYETGRLHNMVVTHPIPPAPRHECAPAVVDRETNPVDQTPKDKSVAGA